MKKLFTLIILFKIALVYSQDHFIPGFIIELNKDTLNGYLNEESPLKSSHYCTFKIKSDSEPIIYNPNEILGYRYKNGNYYVSKQIPIDSIEKIQVFLKCLIKGRFNIYSYLKDVNRICYFVENQSNQLIELKNSDVEKTDEFNRKYAFKKREYIGTMIGLTQEKELIPLITESQLNDRSLIKIVKTYTEEICKDTNCIVFEKVKHKSKSEINIMFGKNWTNTNLDDYTLFKYNKFTEENTILIGIGYCLSNMEYLKRNISFQTGIYYNKYSLTSNGRPSPELSFGALHIPVLIGYSVWIGNFEPFFAVGLQLTYKLNREVNNIYLATLSPFTIGPDIELGLKYILSGKYVFQLCTSYFYEYSSIFVQQKHFGNTLSMQLKVGYLF